MTPKEKAQDLISKYYIFNHIGNSHAKKCALIAVDEILERDIHSFDKIYWREVKQEIEKL